MKTFRLERSSEVLLDIGSFARPGPHSQVHLTPAQVAQIHRTVTRVPEVVIKVTSGGGAIDIGGIRRHLGYIGRHGELAIETEDGDQLQGRGVERRLIED